MGVKQCSRNSCDNILCDRYSSEYGYICNECFNEMVNKATVNDELSILDFMASIKGDDFSHKHIEKLLNNEFKLRE